MVKWLSTRRFDLLQVLLFALLVGIVSWGVGRTRLIEILRIPSPEARALSATYGPDRYSENEEEWIVRDFFKDRREGVFADIGANHYKTFSNTYYLETQLGWSGVAVDPQEKYEADYKTYRPRTRFFPLFVSDVSHEKARVYVLDRVPLVASGRRDFVERWGTDAKEVGVPTITLNDLLEQLGIQRLDLLSVDVELSEPKVLAGFDIEKTKPALVCIEAHPEVRQQILDYFAAHHYVVVGKYLRVDTKNLYFKPIG